MHASMHACMKVLLEYTNSNDNNSFPSRTFSADKENGAVGPACRQAGKQTLGGFLFFSHSRIDESEIDINSRVQGQVGIRTYMRTMYL